MKVYERFDIDEETPVQFVAVHPLRWRPAWGEPTDMFREMPLEDVPEVAALVEALRAHLFSDGTHAALESALFQFTQESPDD